MLSYCFWCFWQRIVKDLSTTPKGKSTAHVPPAPTDLPSAISMPPTYAATRPHRPAAPSSHHPVCPTCPLRSTAHTNSLPTTVPPAVPTHTCMCHPPSCALPALMRPAHPPAPCLPPACHCPLPPICAHLLALGNLTDPWDTIYQKHHPHLDTSTHITFSGLSFTPYHAGHVVGACMFMIDIAGLKILYMGTICERKIDIL